MTFLDAAPRVFGCFDQPDLKAPYSMRVTAPDDWTVLGNGRATQRARAGGSWPRRSRWRRTSPPSSPGPYHSSRPSTTASALGLHCRQSLARTPGQGRRRALRRDRPGVRRVPSAVRDPLSVRRLPPGLLPRVQRRRDGEPGLRHSLATPSCSRRRPTHTLRATRAEIVVHEMAHQWFGDLVTMKWWDDLWLNESFADYMGYRVTNDATKFDEVWAEFAYIRKSWGMAADQRTSTHPIAGNGARDTQAALADFDGISYCKGAAALRQLDKLLGDDAFLAGVRAHLNRPRFGNAGSATCSRRGTTPATSTFAPGPRRGCGRRASTPSPSARDDSGQPVIRRTNGSPDVARAACDHRLLVRRLRARSSTSPYHDRRPTRLPCPFDGYDGSGLVAPRLRRRHLGQDRARSAIAARGRRRCSLDCDDTARPRGRLGIASRGAARQPDEPDRLPRHRRSRSFPARPTSRSRRSSATSCGTAQPARPPVTSWVLGSTATRVAAWPRPSWSRPRRAAFGSWSRPAPWSTPPTIVDMLAILARRARARRPARRRRTCAGGMTRRLAAAGQLTPTDIDAELQRDPSSQGRARPRLRPVPALPDADEQGRGLADDLDRRQPEQLRAVRPRRGLLPPRAGGAHRDRTSRGTSTTSPRWPRLAAA